MRSATCPQWVCPASISGKPLSPKDLILDLRHHLLKRGPLLLRNGAVATTAVRRRVARRSAGRPTADAPEELLGSVHRTPTTVFTSDGVGLSVEIEDATDDPTAPTIVFVPGFCLNMDVWHFQRLDLRDRRLGIDHMRLEGARIAGDRELHHERRSRPDPAQLRQERLHVPGPEHKARRIRRSQRHPIGRAAIGAADLGEAGLEPRQEPGGVEGRDIRAIARRNEHVVIERHRADPFLC